MNPTPPTQDPWFGLNRKTRALVVVDLVESVRLMQADEAGTIDRWRRFAADVRSRVLPRHQGRLVKSLGDGLLLEFEHVHAALAAALDIQRGICPYNIDRAADAAMHLRAGVHVAEVVVDDLDIYGAGVNLAARLAGLAGPGEIVVSTAVRDQAVLGLDAEFEDMGLCYLKHLNEPVQAYRAVPVQAGPDRHFAGGLKNMPVVSSLVPAMAIIPFSVHSPEPEHRVVGELLADTLIAKMAGADRLRVISRLSTTALASRACTAAEMGRLLGANFVASGRVQVQGGRLLLWVELADARSDQVVWADRFNGAVAELAERDSPVIEEVCAALIRHVAVHELRRVQHLPLPTLEGFSLQLSGMALMHRSTKQEFDRAREVLEYLIDRHPRAPEPRAWLAKWYMLRVTRNWVEDLASESARALEQTQRALDISPECSLALAMEGFVHCHMRRDLDAAQDALEQALVVNPSNSLAWLFISVVQGFLSNGADAVSSADKALSLSPLDPLRHYFDALACTAHLAVGDYPKTIALAKRALNVDRNHLPTLRALAAAYAESADEVSANSVAQRIIEIDPTFTVRRFLEKGPRGGERNRARYAQALLIAGIPSD